jgi:hypothetical protein
VRIIPDLEANIRVTVTFETSTGIRREEFAITHISGSPSQNKRDGFSFADEYADVLRAKVGSAVEAAFMAIIDRVKPDTWVRLEKAGRDDHVDAARASVCEGSYNGG